MLYKYPLPYEIRRAVLSYLQRTGQTVEYGSSTRLIKGKPCVDDVERAWLSGAIGVDDDGVLNICDIAISFAIDSKRVRNKVEEHLRKNARTSEIVGVAAILGISL